MTFRHYTNLRWIGLCIWAVLLPPLPALCSEGGDAATLTRVMEFDGRSGSSEGLVTPVDVCCDAAGILYVADRSTDRILKFTEEGRVLLQFGGFGDGKGRLNEPVGLATDGFGHIYVAELGNRRIQKFDLGGTSVEIFVEEAESPVGIVVSQGPVVYVTDGDEDKLFGYDSEGEVLLEMGEYGWGEGFFDGPSDVDSDPLGNLLVVDRGNKRVQVFDKDGHFQFSFGSDILQKPNGICVDGKGRAYVTDSGAGEVVMFSREGKSLGSSHRSGLKSPAGVCVSGSKVFVADAEKHTVVVLVVLEGEDDTER